MADPIMVDFEGFADKRPVLAGVLVDGRFTQTAFIDIEPAIAVAARACGLECADFRTFCEALIAKAREEKRAIAGFSKHERDRIAEGLVGGWPDDVRYVDAKTKAKSWRSARHPEAAAAVSPHRDHLRSAGQPVRNAGNRLIDFVQLMGVDIPPCYGDRGVTKTLRRLLAQSTRQRRYRRITPQTREAWRGLLAHNRLDCVWALKLIHRAERSARVTRPRSTSRRSGTAGCRPRH
jgi:hypothetical protein